MSYVTENISITYADPSVLSPNDWNTNIVTPENEHRLDESIDRLGMFKPILVRELGDGSLQILGGQHRAQRAAARGMKSVPIINLGSIDDKRAKEIGLVDNGRYGVDDTLALAKLFDELGKKEELAEFLPYSDSEFDAIFGSVNIDISELDIDDEDDPEEIHEAEPAPVQTHQIMRFKVPVIDAHKVTEMIEKTINQQGFSDSDSLTNAGDALVYLLLNE